MVVVFYISFSILTSPSIHRPCCFQEKYVLADVRTGAALCLCGRMFELLEADEFTEKVLQERAEPAH